MYGSDGPRASTASQRLPPHQAQLLIADRRPIAADGLAAALEPSIDLTVQACCHDARELATVFASCSMIEAVVIDAEMFDGDASQAVEAIRLLDPGIAILLLTTHVDQPLLEGLAHERVSCVSAYSEVQPIVSALRALLSGQTLLPSEVQRALADALRQPSSPPNRPLTSREEQVLELAATGLTTSQIGARLHISHSTAKTHLLRIYEKLESPNRSAAVATAITRGLLPVSAVAA
jgi:DNA-binding NarL/FixJ family response regulator